MEVYFFSFTGNCRKIAGWIAEKLGVEANEIKAPNFPYIVWLLLSFIPQLGIKSDVRPPQDEKIVLCFPKWTLNCPPITYFLKKYAEGREVYMVICFGGFDEKRYAESYKRFALKRAKKADYLLIKRRLVEEDAEKVKNIVYQWLKTTSP